MANLNEFKILNIKCSRYFDLLAIELGLEAEKIKLIDRTRIGFYFFIIDAICGVSDIKDAVEIITDTNFNEIVFNSKHDDCGIDAVYIDEETKIISLFNFKFREKFNKDSTQSLNDSLISAKYLNVLNSESTKGLSGKPKHFAQKIIEKLNENEVWNLILYQVSNESKETVVLNEHIENLQLTYDLKIEPIALPSISQMLSIRPAPINAILLLEQEALMSYSEDSLSSSVSYIARIRGSEIVRITSKSRVLRDKYNIEDLNELSSVELDFGVLFDNVRGFVLKSKYNPNITKTLKDEPTKFFMYNNGITLVADDIITSSVNGGKKYKVKIEGLQVLNGGQTLRSIHDFNLENTKNISEYLSKSELLVRIFKASQEEATVNKIAEYTNSQNAISPSDLKSLSSVQMDIERFLEENGIIYSRKSGDTGSQDNINYRHKISMEKFGQLLYARSGYPEKASNGKQHIFGKLYTKLFVDEFDIELAPLIIERYFEIIHCYENSASKGLDQKYYYIMYMDTIETNLELPEKINFLERVLSEYEVEKETSDVRKLGQVRFKETLMRAIR